ncbi:nuclease-related domain-containing protein [Streptomyces albireticuli]|uniref:nuclease-related domain-containing protein n=1 Tax=Streptomyces albireticuli TaxID=1940 RepID=UPI00117BFD64|nr:nuclease-related domain-containing protein [Streptomyces albireticuli]MCD9140615.1 NERD domain-containing protein [Streptomyces albireticuli]MCD9161423.1 NERD domain-containing protein [Streptomyces albireticuli]MCD9193007.1 NERD domain-containing protein [Streptomyces albireticuli]
MRDRPDGKRSANGKSYDPERLFLPPDDDLAPNRPGETLRARLDASGTGRLGLVCARLLGRRPVEDVWRRALEAEQRVGADLEELTGGGWEVVHSIVLPGDAVIPHLLIGPGGVFGIAALPGRRARVHVGETLVRLSRERQPWPYVRQVRHDTTRASMVLSRGCGFLVRVRPVLVLVGAESVEVAPALEDVRVLRDTEVAELGAAAGELHPQRADRVHTVARNRRVWLWA